MGSQSASAVRITMVGLFVLAVLLAAAAGQRAAAHGTGGSDSDEPSTGSHTENPRQGLEEVGFHDLGNTGFNTDVWAWTSQDGGLYATSGTWGTLIGDDPCPSETDDPLSPTKSGVKIVDATDAANPVMVSRIATVPGSQNNDPKVARIEIPGGFSGDILSHSLEPCGAELVLFGLTPLVEDVPSAQTGFQLYNVSDAANPVKLGTYNNGGLGTHNHYIYGRPDLGRAFVAAVFNEAPLLFETRGEIQFVEITDPNAPTLVSTWELADAADQGGPTVEELCHERGTHLASCVLHDVWLNADGTIAYLSYWDAGLILLDVTNPAAPTFIGQIQSGTLDEEGNTHAAVPMTVDGRDVVIVGDEDFVGPGPLPHVTVDASPDAALVEESFVGTEFTNTRPLSAGSVGSFAVLLSDDGFGCAWTTAGAVGATLDGWIGIARRGGTCPLFQQKVTAAETAGADGLIVVNDGPGSVSGLAASTTMPAMMIPQESGEAIIAGINPTDPTASKATLELLPPDEVDPWGFMRVMDVTNPWPDWQQVATFKAPHVDTEDQPGESVFSAHNPIIGPDGRVYFAWYTDGVRVLEMGAGGSAVSEVAWFVPLPTDHEGDLDSDPHGVQEDNFGFWGSIPICHPTSGELLIFNSDFNRGLYILRSTIDDCRVPDLEIDAEDISLSTERVQGGDQVTITASVDNLGDGAAADVVVRFEGNATQIGSDQIIASIPAGGSGEASVVWDTKHLQGEHTITVTVDPDDLIEELDEANNAASVTVTVRGNKVVNGSFEASSSGDPPDSWTSSGETSYASGGSDGERSVTAGPTGSWTSESIAVEAGASYGLAVDVTGAGGSLLIEQLNSSGTLLGTLALALPAIGDGAFETVWETVTIADGVTEVRVRLTGPLAGTGGFDNVWMWEE